MEDSPSLAQAVFLLEIVGQCESAERARQRMSECLAEWDNDGFWDAVEQLLSAAIRVSNILWPSSNKAKVRRRAKELRRRYGIENQDGYPGVRAVRNGFEHIDERIDDWGELNADFYHDRQIIRPSSRVYMGSESELVAANTARSYDMRTSEIRVFGEVTSADGIANELNTLRAQLLDSTGR